jgi:hypothetical protein
MVTEQTIIKLGLEIDDFFASLNNTQQEIIIASLSIISFKIKDGFPEYAEKLMSVAKGIMLITEE